MQHTIDALNYTSFWWRHAAGEKTAFGFVVSPRLSLRLQKACRAARAAFEAGGSQSPWPLLDVFVQSTMADGCSHVVEATLPGESEECV